MARWFQNNLTNGQIWNNASPCPEHCIMSWAGVVKDIKTLKRYEWCGHSVMMGITKRPWQDTDTVLSYFGKRRKRAIEKYEQFFEHGVKAGSRPELMLRDFLV
ncbi:MAG: hypothetical protein R6V46_05175 [Desulfatiglandaceae bacterium]